MNAGFGNPPPWGGFLRSNCDELETPYRGKNWYGDPNSSQLAQLLGFGYDPHILRSDSGIVATNRSWGPLEQGESPGKTHAEVN